MRFNRRAPSGDVFADAFLRSRGPLCFDELLELSTDGVPEVSAWLGNAIGEGLIEEVAGSERCFRLKARGRRVLGLRQGVRDRRATSGAERGSGELTPTGG